MYKLLITIVIILHFHCIFQCAVKEYTILHEFILIAWLFNSKRWLLNIIVYVFLKIDIFFFVFDFICSLKFNSIDGVFFVLFFFSLFLLNLILFVKGHTDDTDDDDNDWNQSRFDYCDNSLHYNIFACLPTLSPLDFILAHTKCMIWSIWKILNKRLLLLLLFCWVVKCDPLHNNTVHNIARRIRH